MVMLVYQRVARPSSLRHLFYELPETNSEFTPESLGLEDDPFLLEWLIFRCELLVLGSVSRQPFQKIALWKVLR